MTSRLPLFKSIAFIAGLSLLAVSGLPVQGQEAKAKKPAHNKKGAPPTAASLVKDMKASLAFIAKNSKDISPKSKQAVPFYAALKSTAKGLDQLEKGIADKSPEMLKGLDTTGEGVTQISTTWAIIRGAHPKSQVGRGVKSLDAAYEMYLSHFGPSVAILKKGGGKKGKLTDAELAEIQGAGPKMEELIGNLKQAQAAAKPKSYQHRMIADLIGLATKILGIQGTDRGTYAKYQYQTGRLRNSMGAYGNISRSYYPDYYQSSWGKLTPFVNVLTSIFGGSAWGYYDGWNYYDSSIANYGSYYESTSISSSISSSEVSSYEESVESYSEESATEEDAEDEEEIDEEQDEEEDDDQSLADEAADCEDDDDGDGISDEEDDDDDNDGVSDEEDTDDDGDGEADEEDADEDEEEEEEDDGDDDDCDGAADCDDGGCCEE